MNISYIGSMKYKIGFKNRLKNIVLTISILSLIIGVIVLSKNIILSNIDFNQISFLEDINRGLSIILFIVTAIGLFISLILNRSVYQASPDKDIYRQIEEYMGDSEIEVDKESIYITLEEKINKNMIYKAIDKANKYKDNKYQYSLQAQNGYEVVINYIDRENIEYNKNNINTESSNEESKEE